MAVASNDGTIKTLELKSGHLSSLLGHEDKVQSVIFDHMAEHLISGGSDGTIRIWNWDPYLEKTHNTEGGL